MKKYTPSCSFELIFEKENLYKNSQTHNDGNLHGCCRCHGEQQYAPDIYPASTDGLKELIGIPQPWPLAEAPEGWLKCNGQTFDTAKYPQLAKLYPAGTLPDLRGEFIRGWDDERGVDTDRKLLSAQAGTHILGDDGGYPTLNSIGNLSECNADKPDGNVRTLYWLDTNKSEKLASEKFWGATRPRNIAFSYIVKAG
ncbi:Tail Collar domain protein [Dickeya chrysanthemi Ech1591]|uniref:Tail Collar domain protein n=1 Tax=Dickeya chrysanthemi (strain Ech1591) TaxID=561229 RepID=C6CG98_DICC1|nr:phage tail protein [Dickeya chrysanthemi]ACT06668.1 Tail Collar domain protein [Dickeya chrysanthemi Ech1591]